MQVMSFVFAAKCIEPAKFAVAGLLIKAERLKTERIEKGALAAPLTGCVCDKGD